MHELIAWCGFFGGWLLVAGPLLQAAIELEEEGIDRDKIATATANVERPRRVSPWWWLLPPVAYVLERRRNRNHRNAVIAALPREHAEQLVRFGGKATGWAFVAGGAGLIAVKETWELHEAYHWPTAVFWVLLPVMIVLAALNTVFRMRRAKNLIGGARDPVD